MFEAEAALAPASALKPHEMILKPHLKELRSQIEDDGRIYMPIVVDRRSMTILDGHHRYAALTQLRAELVPALLVDYECPELEVHPRRIRVPLSKRIVVEYSSKGLLFPPKTTRHVLPVEPREVSVPLRELKRCRL
ncbi:MAG: transcriptional regulator [Thermoproteota archaeon]|nr:MAG: transcriptional regulator [Candidatus Korarchaeota archaeon]